jgi:SAM-dependent methyltransferase
MGYIRTSWSNALRHLYQKGLFSTLKRALFVIPRDFRHWWFDYKWRVNTKISASDPPKSEPTELKAFEEIMQGIRNRNTPMPQTFFDMGCGKGRVLIMASEYGFNPVIGVEFNSALAKTAEENVSRYQTQQAKRTEFKIVCEDAGTYSFPDTNAVIYFYNPFDETIMVKTLENIRRSAHMNKERYIIYHNPVHESLLSNPMDFALLVRGSNYSVYQMIF